MSPRLFITNDQVAVWIKGEDIKVNRTPPEDVRGYVCPLVLGSVRVSLGCVSGVCFEETVLKSEHQSGGGHLETIHLLLCPDLVLQVGTRQ